MRCYPYKGPDGSERWADPLLTRRHLVALFEGDLARVTRELRSDNPGMKHSASAAVRFAVTEAFFGPEAQFNPSTGGVTLEYAEALLADFLTWIAGQKKSGGTPSDSPSAESPPPYPPPYPPS